MTTSPETPEKMNPVSTANGAASSLGFWMNGSKEALERWTRSNVDALKGATDLSQEIMAFSQDRFQANVDGWKTLTECRSPADFIECQSRFVGNAATQYADEVNKLTSRVMTFMTDTAAHFRQGSAANS